MKYALIIPDGCADEPQPSLGGQTPLQAAHVPNMDEVARLGEVGLTNHVPDSMPSGSDVGTMSLFGYSPLEFHTGRAPIEAAAQGITLGPDDWAIRCNFVTVDNGRMQSFTAGQIPNALAQELIQRMQKAMCGDPHWKFYPGVSYRNLLIYRARDGKAPFSSDTWSVPPHDIVDQTIADSLPMGAGACDLRALMERSISILAESPANQARVAKGELPATQIWLWGLGKTPSLPSFSSRFGVRAAVITAVDLLRGLARLVEMEVINVEGATGYLDTNYAGKGQAAIDALQRLDFVVVHVEATDEASHEGNATEKVHALENIDRHIVGPVHDWLKSQGDYRILVCPDHPTFLRTKTHSHGLVPFAVCGAGIAAGEVTSYDEVSAAATKLVIPAGHDLMPRFTQH